jgi:hypothetical protein
MASRLAQVKAWLSQFTTYMFGAGQLTADDYIPQVIVLRQPLNTTTTTNNDTYRVPSNYNFLIQRVRGHFGFKALTSETLSVTGVGNLGVVEHLLMKTSNCRIDFTNSDSKLAIVDNQQLVLSAIMGELGGAPIEFDPPLVILEGQTIKATMTLTDTTAAVVGANAEYGLVLEGVLVRSDAG